MKRKHIDPCETSFEDLMEKGNCIVHVFYDIVRWMVSCHCNFLLYGFTEMFHEADSIFQTFSCKVCQKYMESE